MLLIDLKKVRDIDSKIGDMHRRLADLYLERSLLMKETVSDEPAETEPSTNKTTRQLYEQVAYEWGFYAITLPAYSLIKNKFAKAEKVLRKLQQTHPEIADCMEIVAVPPTKLMKFPLSQELRAKQKLVELHDFIQADIKPAKQQKQWQIFLAYTNLDSLYAGSAKKILEDKSYILSGYDTRGLGLREYAALTLQKNILFDNETWTVLLKDTPKNGQVPYVGYRHGRYRYDLEELDNVLDDDGFRPAIRL